MRCVRVRVGDESAELVGISKNIAFLIIFCVQEMHVLLLLTIFFSLNYFVPAS